MIDGLVSILTPSYNQARWLPDNLASVRCQTYREYEHIVVDGASTDETTSILQRATDPRLRWTSEPDRGQSDALNRALARSRGEIIAWLNSDDTFADRRALAWVVRTFKRYPEVDVVYGHVLDTTENGEVVRLNWVPPLLVHALNSGVNPMTQPGVFYRRRALENNFVRNDLHYAMDYELFMRLLRQGYRARRLDRVLATNRHQMDRKSMARPPRFDEEYRAVRAAESRRDRLTRPAVHYLAVGLGRFGGALPFLRLPYRVQPAVTLTFPNWQQRLKLQTATRTEQHLRRRAARAGAG